MNDLEKSEFISKMEDVAKQVTELVKKTEGRKSVILIATDSYCEGTNAIIACAGSGGELVKGLTEFAMQETTSSMFAEAMKLVAMRKILKLIKKDCDGDCDECEREQNGGKNDECND